MLTPFARSQRHLAKSSVLLHGHLHEQKRLFSDQVEGKVNADPDEVAELIESSIVRPSKASREQHQSPIKLLTTRREALSLYREILRYSNLFVWRDEHGRRWKDVIRASARQEFEQARFEPDPELINRMIVTGRDAVQRTMEAFMKRRARIIEEEEQKPQGPHF